MVSRSWPNVWIITLNYNQWSLTCDCLKSLLKVEYPNKEVVVVDNGSNEDPPDNLQEDFRYVRLIRNDSNLGVAGGRNLGAHVALENGADYVLFLDNDTLLDPNFLRELVQVAESNAQIGAVGPKIKYINPANEICFTAGIFYSGISHSRVLGSGQIDRGQFDRIIEAAWLSGCANLNKRSLFEKIGFLDEDFSPYSCEDVDWGIRARRAGFKLVYVPSAIIWHRDWAKAAKSPSKVQHVLRGKVLLIRKHLRRETRLIAICWLLVHCLYRYLVPALIHGKYKLAKSCIEGLSAGFTQDLAQAKV